MAENPRANLAVNTDVPRAASGSRNATYVRHPRLTFFIISRKVSVLVNQMDIEMNHIVRQLSLFYKNDKPDGFGVTLDDQFFADNPEAGSLFEQMSQCSINKYKTLKTEQERNEFVADVHSQFADVYEWHHTQT